MSDKFRCERALSARLTCRGTPEYGTARTSRLRAGAALVLADEVRGSADTGPAVAGDPELLQNSHRSGDAQERGPVRAQRVGALLIDVVNTQRLPPRRRGD